MTVTLYILEWEVRPNKKVAPPYLNLLVKHRFFSSFFFEKNIILCILKGKMPFKMRKIIFFQNKVIRNQNQNVCLPYL